jgi:ribosomal-protein-alanine N-acetyltransferase
VFVTRIDAMRDSSSDVDAAVAIDLASFVSGELGATGGDPRSARERSLREELVRPWARLRAARDDEGRLVGYSLFWHVVDEIHLLNVAVAADARRRGVGRALMNDLLAYARDSGVVRVLLEVRPSNAAAIALYERLGFSTFAIRERYYADGEDAREMDLRLV